MPIPIKISSYNTGLSLYQNAKANFLADRLAKNRWGNKFKKYYNRHKESTDANSLGIYNFTEGMRATVVTIEQATEDKERVSSFLDVFDDKMESFDALEASSAIVTVARPPEDERTVNFGAVVTISEYILGSEDAAYIEWVNNNEELHYYLKLYAEDDVPEDSEDPVEVEIPFLELKEFLDDTLEILEESIDMAENGSSRASDDLDIIRHLGIEETLHDQIDRPNKIKKIWFRFDKPVSSVSNWWESEEFQTKEVTVDGKTVKIYGIADAVKNFQDYCYVEGTGFLSVVKLKPEVMDLPGWKIYWFVNAFLEIKVKAKKESLFKRIFNFILLVVAIYLTVISANPVWLKVVIIGTQIGSYLGVVSPKMALVVSLLSFGYGAFSTNFSAMSSMQLFSWTVQNVEQVFKMLSTYEAIKAQEDMKSRAENTTYDKALSQQQEETMEFIYNDSNDQYEQMVKALFNFAPPLKHIEA